MAYEFITKYNSPNYTNRKVKKKFIVIHHWGVLGSTFMGTVNWLCKRQTKASAQFVAESGRVACLVRADLIAWHAGPKGNTDGIGIECRPEMSAGDFETVAELIADLWQIHGYLPLRAHNEFMNTACPGRWKNELKRLETLAKQIQHAKYGGTAKPKPPTQRVHVVVKGDNLSRIAAKYGVTVDSIVKNNGIKNRNLIYPKQKLVIK